MKQKLPIWALEWNKRNPRLLWKNLSNDEKVIIRLSYQNE